MPRDYSSRRNNQSNGNGKRKSGKRPAPAARPVRRKKSAPRKKTDRSNNNRKKGSATTARAGAPGCIWLLCVIFLCVAGAATYYLATRPAGHGPEGTRIQLPDEQSAADAESTDQTAEASAHNDQSK